MSGELYGFSRKKHLRALNVVLLAAYFVYFAYSHFHLDHCGALPYMSEMVGFDGPIYMTHPTKAICPILLEDYRKITVDRKGETDFFTSQMIKDCMKKVVTVNLHQTVHVSCMFFAKSDLNLFQVNFDIFSKQFLV